MDDYAHHPTAIKTTIEGLKEFYPERRLVVSFMSHTYTRTAALINEFAAAFNDADIVFFHKIYASAREDYSGGITGRTLYEKAGVIRAEESSASAAVDAGAGAKTGETVYYIEEPLDAMDDIKKTLRPGDLFISMGAGNNWHLTGKLFAYYEAMERDKND